MKKEPQESKPSFVYVTYIRTTPEKLWEALTRGDFSEKYWFGYRIESDWKVGSDFQLHAPKKSDEPKDGQCNKNWNGKVLAYDPYQRLTYTSSLCSDHNAGEDERHGPTTITYELKAMGPLVRLRLIHENLMAQDIESDPNVWKGVNNGWPAVMNSLKSLLETGQELVYQS